MSPIRLYVFDADNTLRRTLPPGQPCPRRRDEWALLPGVHERLARIDFGRGGARVAIASNQDQIGYGLLSHALARRMLHDLARAAIGATARRPFIALCPHRLEVPCRCRKPAPGMLLAAMAHFGVEPHETLFVGDAICDCTAARRAGTHFLPADEFFRETGNKGYARR